MAKQVLALIRQRHLDRRPDIARYIPLLERGQVSDVFASQILAAIDSMQEGLSFLPRPPTAIEMAGMGSYDILFGSLAERPDVRIGARFLNGPCHIMAAGTTGSGKTTCIRRFVGLTSKMAELLGRPISTIVFSLKKDFLDCIELYGSRWRHFDLETLCIGLQAPKDVPVKEWIAAVVASYASRAGLKFASTAIAKSIEIGLPALNPDPGNPHLWPSIAMLRDICKIAPAQVGAKPAYVQSAVHSFETLLQAHSHVFEAFRGFDVEEEIISKGLNAVFEIPQSQPAFFQHFLVDLILLQIFKARLARGHKVDATEVVIVINEADENVSVEAARAFDDGLTPIGRILKQGREFGIMVVLGLTLMKGVDEFVRSGIGTHLIFRQDPDSIDIAANALQLPSGARPLLGGLPAGRCLMRQSQFGHCNAMLVKIDPLAPCRSSKIGPYDPHTYIPAKPLSEMPEVCERLKQLLGRSRAEHARTARETSTELSKAARKLLDLASLHPFLPVARLWEKLPSTSFVAQAQAHAELKQRSLAHSEEVRIGKTNVLLIDILEAGWQVLNKPVVPRPGRGGIAHVHFANWIRMLGEKRGYQSECEWIIPGTSHPADAMWLVDGRYVIFEVIVEAKANVASHIHACLGGSSAVESLTLVTTQIKEMDKYRKMVASDSTLAPFASRLRYETISTFMKELWP